MSFSSYRTFRWVMTALGLAAAALLLANGNTLVGLVIGGLATVRLVFLLALERRRRQFRTATEGGRDGGGGAGPAAGDYPVLRSLARGQFEVAAGAIGTSPAEVRIEFANGHSIAEVAATRGVPVDSVVAAVIADASAKLDRAVADGRTSRFAADRFKSRLPQWATRLVNGHRGDFRTRAGAFG
jgi:hypothetical protein